jgi:hypothetical protein
VLAVLFYRYEVIRYIWFVVLFATSAALVPIFLIDLYFKKFVNKLLLAPSVILLGVAIYFSLGERVVLFGIGVGITYTLALLLGRLFKKP